MKALQGARRKAENRMQESGARSQNERGSGLKVQSKETLVAKALVTLMPVHKDKLSPKG